MGTRERHRQLALALFRSTATVLQNQDLAPDLLGKILGPRITSTSANAAAVSKTWRQVVDAQGVDRYCTKRQSVEDFYFSSLYTPHRVHMTLSNCITNQYHVGILVSWIYQSKSLVSLDLSTNNMNRHMTVLMRALARSKLHTLNLHDCQIKPDGAKALADALRDNVVLKKILLTANMIKDKGAIALGGALKNNKTLKELELKFCDIGPEGGKALASALSEGSAGRSERVLESNMTKDEGAIALGEALKSNKTLEELDLFKCSIGAEGAKALASALSEGSAVLTSLNLEMNHVGPEGAKALAAALRVNRVLLTNLNIKDNALGGVSMWHPGEGTYDPSGIEALASALAGNSVLTNLSVAHNPMNGEGAQQLAAAALGSKSLEVLSQVPIKELRADTLTEVNLTIKGLGPTEGIVLAELIKGSRKLNKLNLSGNMFGDEGAIALCEALKSNKTLKELQLRSCDIGAEGGKALASALSVNRVLTTLDLSGNRLEAEGAKALARALSVNRVLTSLELYNNVVGPEGAKALADALRVNAVLTKLTVFFNNIGDEGEKALRDAAKGREGFELII